MANEPENATVNFCTTVHVKAFDSYQHEYIQPEDQTIVLTIGKDFRSETPEVLATGWGSLVDVDGFRNLLLNHSEWLNKKIDKAIKDISDQVEWIKIKRATDKARVRSTKAHHRVEWSHNGERSREESCWYWECVCGSGESASTKAEAQREWISHLRYRLALKLDKARQLNASAPYVCGVGPLLLMRKTNLTRIQHEE